ncbi:hypothetical protein [Pseudomonas frederiksbergensis]|uniref:hypothetical protein n=1 Tax=Pseudomonas frederiksbergensis TaxID=104087 RepID=UPI003D23B176
MPDALDVDGRPVRRGCEQHQRLRTSFCVAWEQAPFDHPSLVIPQDYVGDENAVTARPVSPKISTRQALDALISLKPIGAEGRSVSGGPLQASYNDL